MRESGRTFCIRHGSSRRREESRRLNGSFERRRTVSIGQGVLGFVLTGQAYTQNVG